ncbi:tetratricopeptide repeat protein [bacterium]|nr:tetratricopeptide repeat protein [bacterium]
MKKIIKQIIALTALLLFMLAATARVFASFEDLGAGARAAGMANAFTAIADDAYAVYYNPAGLAGLRNPEAASSMGKMFMNLSDNSDIGDTNLMMAYPLKFAVMGIGVKNFALDGYYGENQYAFAAARRFRYFDLGVSLKQMTVEYGSTKYTANAIDNNTGFAGGAGDPVFDSGLSKSGFGADAGILKKSGDLSFGIALQNIVAPDMGLKETYKLPLRIKTGMALIKPGYKLSGEYNKEESAGSFRLGAEVNVLTFFRLRGGFEYGPDIANISAGASYRMNLFSFDYAFTLPLSGVEETLGNHWIGLSVRFGELPEQVMASEKTIRESGAAREKKDPMTEKIRKLTLKNMKRLYLLALAAEKRGEYENARRYHQQVIVYNVPTVVSGDPEIMELISKSREAQDKHGDRVSSAPTDIERMKKHFSTATEYYKNKEYEKAVKEWKKVLEIDPAHKLSLAKIALAEAELAEEKEQDKLKKMKEHFSKATVYYIKGEYARAIKEWQKVLELDPSHELSRQKIMQAQEKLKNE